MNINHFEIGDIVTHNIYSSYYYLNDYYSLATANKHYRQFYELVTDIFRE
jgi:hypothetical protein